MNKEKLTHNEFTNKMFYDASVNINTNDYKNLLNKDEFKTKLTGVAYDNRQTHISYLAKGEELFLIHDKGNKHHQNAIKVVNIMGEDVGFLPRELADEMIKELKYNNRRVFVEEITGDSETDEFRGVNICIKKVNVNEEKDTRIKSYPNNLKKHNQLLSISTELGVESLYEKHKPVINKILRSSYTSLHGNDEYEKKIIIMISAIYKAMKYKQKSIFLYNDKQTIFEDSRIFSLVTSKFALNIQEFNPERLSSNTIEDFMEYMDNIDILIITYSNLDKINMDYDKVGLVVHNHIDQNLKYIKVHQLKQLNSKSFIFNHYNFNKISQQDLADTFGVRNFFEVNADGYVPQAAIVDKRNIRDKNLFIHNFFIRNEKSIVYTNTRRNAVDIARRLRSQLPKEMKDKIMFYHGGMSLEDRKIVEEKFLNNEYLFVVSTTAFDIALYHESSIKNVFVYNPPYTYNTLLNQIIQTAKFNKCSVYLVYSYTDIHEIKRIIGSNIIDKSDLTYVYRALQSMLYQQIKEKYGYFHCKNHQLRNRIAEMFHKHYSNNRLEVILNTLEEMKVIGFDKKSNDLFIEIYDVVEKANFEETETYINNMILINMFIEFELLLSENIHEIGSALFNMEN